MRKLGLVFVLVAWVAPAWATVITTGDVDPGGTGTQPDPWNVSDDLTVGLSGIGTLNIGVGGEVFNAAGSIGSLPGSTGIATVTGAGSKWTNSGGLTVGHEGDGTLNVAAGGVVSNGGGRIGWDSGTTGIATVTGVGSKWTNSGVLYVGRYGSGTLNVEAGGEVSNTRGYIGYKSNLTGMATVSGAGSKWNNSAELTVGDGGNGILNVEVSGEVSNTVGYIGLKSGSTGAATVAGTGSKWNNSDDLTVGSSGSGTLNVAAGGEVSSTHSYMGYYRNSTGAATVSGAGSKWVNSAELYVGRSGNATLNVVAGGVVSNTFSYIGYKSNSTGVATITGADSKWTSSNSLTIAGGDTAAGGSATLNVNESGLVTVLGTTKLWDGGIINLDGGTLDTGTLDLTAGTFNMVDGLLRTDSVNGDITIQGGTMAPGHSPAIAAINGDYTQGAGATLEIELAGTGAGEFDLLMIGGTGNLDGTLNLVPLTPYTDPATRGTADEFVIIAATAGSGAFNTVQYDGSSLAADFGPDGNGSFRSHVGGGLFRNVTYTATTAQQCSAWCSLVRLQNLLALPGDTDGDMDVDLSDYNTITTNFDPIGTYGPYLWQDGNFDGNGNIDLSDYNALASNFQPLGYGTAAVPEPTSVFLLLAGVLAAVVANSGPCRIR